MKKVLITLFVGFLAVGASAQDYHLSQFDVMPLALNPGYTGMTTKKLYRAASVYRSQWRQLSSRPFSTFGFSYDMKFRDRWGLGGYIINNDGARTYNSLSFIASGAYEVSDPQQKEHKITVGLQAGIIYNTINQTDLTFDNQYAEGDFTGNLPSMESFDRYNKVLPDVNVGATYKWTDPTRWYHPYGAFAINHLLSPKMAFVSTTNEAARLPRKFTLNGGSEFEVDNQLSFDAKVLTMFQGQASEILFGANTIYKLEENGDVEVQLGVYYRNQDAFIISTGIDYSGLIFVMSFDFTTSELSQYGQGTGALEFSLVFSPSSRTGAKLTY